MAPTTVVTPDSGLEAVGDLARQLRADGIRASTEAGSGHPTSSMSAADLMAVLLARHLRYSWDKPEEPSNDHLVFSKGHASPLLYSMFKAAGVVSDDELVKTYRRLGARLQGHPTPALPWVEVATGSLGQGLPDAVGMALAGRYLDKLPFHVWVLCGDSEMAEGSMWEAMDKAGFYQLGNLTPIVDVNRLGQRGETEYGWDLDVYRRRIEAFGCRAVVVDGHDLAAIDAAFADARSSSSTPVVVLAKTVKGKGFTEVEDREGWHGRPLPPEMAERALGELAAGRPDAAGAGEVLVKGMEPPGGEPAIEHDATGPVELPVYEVGQKVATRKAYGDALRALGSRPDVVALDGEVGNSTHAEEFREAYPERFFEMFIAEQQLVAAAVGLAARGYVPFASTFAAFFARAYDFVRMAAISDANIRLSGSHAGVEIGADGPSQMALEDLAAMRAIHGSTVLYPSDATSAAHLVRTMADTDGILYVRTTRGAYPVIYGPEETFPLGGSKVLRQTDDDQVALVGAGVTLHECLAAADDLEREGVRARVIDLYSVKPVDVATLSAASRVTAGRIVVVEDHYPQGGLGDAVLEALCLEVDPPRVAHLAVRGLPGSGTSAELLDEAGISARHILDAARVLLEA